MPLPYYQRLSASQKRIYDRSARISCVPLDDATQPAALARELEAALATEDRRVVQAATMRFVTALCEAIGVEEPVVVEVLAKRPSSRWGELHGLYTREEDAVALIQVWMRTAAQRRVVAFRTFLRTVLHEVLHHLDYAYFRLPDSLHTEGFYQRESDLARKLLGPSTPRAEPEPEPVPKRPARPARVREVAQLSLFDVGVRSGGSSGRS